MVQHYASCSQKALLNKIITTEDQTRTLIHNQSLTWAQIENVKKTRRSSVVAWAWESNSSWS